jgi:hypothetical protein
MGKLEVVYPDFLTYCNQCKHQATCKFNDKFREIDNTLSDLIADMQDWYCNKFNKEDAPNFYALIVLPQPCPFLEKVESEAQ